MAQVEGLGGGADIVDGHVAIALISPGGGDNLGRRGDQVRTAAATKLGARAAVAAVAAGVSAAAAAEGVEAAEAAAAHCAAIAASDESAAAEGDGAT